jgi:hypothetical protein
VSKNHHQWITDRPPTAADTSESAEWCVDIVDRSGPVLGMHWEDADLQEFPANTTSVIAWRPALRHITRAKEQGNNG